MQSLPWIAPVAAALINSILGLFTYYKNPKSKTNQFFTIFAFILSLYLLTNQLSLGRFSESVSLIWMRIVMVLATLLNSAFYLLASVFPKKELRMKKRWLYLMGIFTIITSAIAMSPTLFVAIDPNHYKPIPGPGMGIFLLHTAVYLIGGMYVFVKKFLRSTGQEKAQIRFVLLGALTMFSLIFITNIGLVFVLNNSNFVGLLPLYTTLFAGSISYSIIKHRLLDVGALVARAVAFTLMFAIIFGAYTASLLYIVELLPSSMRHLTTSLLIIILVLTFNTFKDSVTKLTEKVFFKKAYAPNQLLDELGKILVSTLSLNILTKKIPLKLRSYLGFSHSSFVFKDTNIVLHHNSQDVDYPLQLSPQEIEYIIEKSHRTPLTVEDVTTTKLMDLFKRIDASIIIPLTTLEKTIGLLVLGPKKSGDIYYERDIQVLKLFTPQLSVAIQNSLSYERIKSFNKTLKEEIEEATEKLKSANKNLRHLDKLKDEFVYVATHELRNPVTAMKGYLSMIEEGSFGIVPKSLKDPLYELSQSNQQLVNLVNDLLQIARAEAHTLKINAIPTNICTLVEGAINSVKPLAQQKKITIRYACNKNSIPVLTDPERLKEVINNLLSNALKYSQKGTITITHLEEENQIITHIKDEGVGIPEKDQSKLFSRFFRVEAEAAKGIPGSGLGLFIVRQLVEKMGGKIWFTSKLNKGSTFSFSLPKA